MAKLFIDKVDIASRSTWFYVLMTKAPVEIYEFNPENEELEMENPLKIVPFLVDGEVKLWGSQATILYIAEKFGSFKGIGKTHKERAKTESVLSWACNTLYRTVAIDFVAPQLYDEDALAGENKKIQIDFATKAVKEQLDVLEKSYLKQNDYILGNEATFLDYYISMILSLVDKVDLDLSKWPKTRKWYNVLKQKVSQNIEMFQE